MVLPKGPVHWDREIPTWMLLGETQPPVLRGPNGCHTQGATTRGSLAWGAGKQLRLVYSVGGGQKAGGECCTSGGVTDSRPTSWGASPSSKDLRVWGTVAGAGGAGEEWGREESDTTE